MKKTLAIFLSALSLFVTALFVGLRTPAPRPDPEPTDSPPEPIRGGGSSTLKMGELVTLEGTLSNGKVLANEPGQLSLLVDLTAADRELASRPSMAVVLVIDRSGSMAGEKMIQAKAAARQLVSRLADDDQMALVTYSSDFGIDIPLTRIKGQRARFERTIEEIMDGGGTDLAGGLQAGLETLRNAGPEIRVRRVILLSDGNANQGITDPGAIGQIGAQARQEGITVSTLGVGLDFNEDLMALIAEKAGGGYYYARDASAIASAFDTELRGLVKLAARRTELGLDLAPGVSIREVYGYRTETRGSRVVIPVGDMTAGERRRVMVELDTGSAPLGAMAIANVVLSYSPAGEGSDREHRGALAVEATTDREEIARSEHRNVTEAFEIAKTAQARAAAAALLQRGDRGNAMNVLRSQIASSRQKNAQLKSPALQFQFTEMESTLDSIGTVSADSDQGKDLIKTEKFKARKVFAY